jgi:hypothetical protein
VQGKGAAAKKLPAPKPSPKAGKAGLKGTEGQDGAPKLERGCMRAVIPLQANVAYRNWLRNGECSTEDLLGTLSY